MTRVFSRLLFVAIFLCLVVVGGRVAYSAGPATHHRTIDVDGVSIFYREAGRSDAPVVLLLHGFPTSSHMFRDLMPLLAGEYRLIAPDFPGFGLSDAPDGTGFKYTFDNLAKVIERFTERLELKRYAIYGFDYGGPIGFRLAMARPEKVSAIISQNANAYEEGLSPLWAGFRKYWADPSSENREAIRAFLKPGRAKLTYLRGTPDASRIAPDLYLLDDAFLGRAGNDEIQLTLLYDYANNLPHFPKVQAYFRAKQPPLLAVWGKNDPLFLPAGAEAFKRDLPKAEVHFLDAGHFALASHADEIAALMRKFLAGQKL